MDTYNADKNLDVKISQLSIIFYWLGFERLLEVGRHSTNSVGFSRKMFYRLLYGRFLPPSSRIINLFKMLRDSPKLLYFNRFMIFTYLQKNKKTKLCVNFANTTCFTLFFF